MNTSDSNNQALPNCRELASALNAEIAAKRAAIASKRIRDAAQYSNVTTFSTSNSGIGNLDLHEALEILFYRSSPHLTGVDNKAKIALADQLLHLGKVWSFEQYYQVAVGVIKPTIVPYEQYNAMVKAGFELQENDESVVVLQMPEQASMQVITLPWYK